jgi:hypothetical protein
VRITGRQNVRVEGTVTTDAAGTCTIGGGFSTSNPSMEDWVLMLEHRRGG